MGNKLPNALQQERRPELTGVAIPVIQTVEPFFPVRMICLSAQFRRHVRGVVV
jgi:hypothetical protein